MTWRVAANADLPGLMTLLRRDEAGSMFPLVNLAEGGLGAEGAQGMRVWVTKDGQAMVGLTGAGALLPQVPGVGLAGLRGAMAGAPVRMAIGRGDQVPAVLAALGLADVPRRHDGTERGYVLDLADLIPPDPQGCVTLTLTAAHLPVVLPWRAAYLAEVFATPPDEAAAQAAKDVPRWIARGSHRLLVQGLVPVAMSGFNAALPEVVQIGGVYVPPGHRGQGFARRVVAAHLAEVRSGGVRRAVLFAVNPAAEAAYRAIGFRPQGSMAIVQFAEPQVVAPAGDTA